MLVKLRNDEQCFPENFISLCVRQKIDNFSLTSFRFEKLVIYALARVHNHQEKINKLVRRTHKQVASSKKLAKKKIARVYGALLNSANRLRLFQFIESAKTSKKRRLPKKNSVWIRLA